MASMDVDEAERSDAILVALQDLNATSIQQNTHEDREARFQAVITDASERADEWEEYYRDRHQCLAENNEDRVSALKAKHQQERQRFDEAWATPTKTRLFSHASNALRGLRMQNMWLMKARRYDDQRLIQQAVNERERFETEEQARAMLMEYEVQLKALTDRQTQEMNALQIANESRVTLLTRAEQRDVLAAKQRVQNLENERKIHRESNRFARGIMPKGRRAGSAQSVAGHRNMPLNMTQIATVQLPPLLPNMMKRPHCYSATLQRTAQPVTK
jgi:hypothetical protein